MVSNSDLQKWQQAIQDIQTAQSKLLPEELSAFNALVELYNTGNFGASESKNYIQVLKQSDNKNRLLQKVYLPNFVALCEQYFKNPAKTEQSNVQDFRPPTYQNPTIQPVKNIEDARPLNTKLPEPEQKQATEKPKGKNAKLIFIIVALALLIGGWQVYQNWDKLFGKPEKIVLNKDSLLFEEINVSEKLTFTIIPDDIPERNKKVIWQSSDTIVANVNENGLVTAISNGSAVIWAKTGNGLSDTCYVAVVRNDTINPEISVNSISLNIKNKTLYVGEKFQLMATVLPEDAIDKTVTWESDNDIVAKIDAHGLVTAVVNGHAVISAYTNNGLSTTCSLQVKIKDVLDPTPVPVPTPAPAQLNNLLNKIAISDDNAIDEIRKTLGNSLRVEGAPNISNVQQLITDVSNGSRYKVTKVNTNADGKIVSISVSK